MAETNSVKFTNDELEKLKGIQGKYASIQIKFGQVGFAKMKIENDISLIQRDEDELKKEFSEIQKNEQEFIKENGPLRPGGRPRRHQRQSSAIGETNE